MNLTRFEVLDSPLAAKEVTEIIREIAGDEFDIQWNQTMVLLADNFGRKVWQYITRSCIN